MVSAGFDIGGTKCAVVLGRDDISRGADGFILDKIKFPTKELSDWKAVLDGLEVSLETLLSRNGLTNADLLGIGISCGGPLDSTEGVIESPPNLPGWDEVPIVRLVSERFGVKVKLENDANACALAEFEFGASRGTKNSVFLTCGTGMGAGLILDGRLYSGTNGMAGEVGHMRLTDDGPYGYGKCGSFEGWCSGGGIADLAMLRAALAYQQGRRSSLYAEFADIGRITARSLSQAMHDGDALANEIMSESAHRFGIALANIIDILNPEIIVIGSIYVRDREFIDSVILPVIKDEALSLSRSVCRIEPAQLGESLGDLAALSLVFIQ